jgi:hypothetical protein
MSENFAVRFIFKSMTFIVKKSTKTGKIVFREEKHLGGPWSDAQSYADNKSLDPIFRRQLRSAIAVFTQ